VALHHASDGEYRLALAIVLQACRFNDRLDGFGLGRIDEPAGVDHHHIGITQVLDRLRAMRDQVSQVPLGLYRILVAPEGDQTEFEHSGKIAASEVEAEDTWPIDLKTEAELLM